MEQYPNPCNRCGYCCEIQVCPVGLSVFGGPKYRPCPALQWEGNESSCGLVKAAEGSMHEEEAKKVIGIGAGCDISAKAVAGGIAYDFASLPDETKIMLAQRQKNGTITTIQKIKGADEVG